MMYVEGWPEAPDAELEGGRIASTCINFGCAPGFEYVSLPCIVDKRVKVTNIYDQHTLTNAYIDRIVDRVLDRFPEIIKKLKGDGNECD